MEGSGDQGYRWRVSINSRLGECFKFFYRNDSQWLPSLNLSLKIMDLIINPMVQIHLKEKLGNNYSKLNRDFHREQHLLYH